MKNNSTISSNKFFLGEGEDGIYSNITIEIKKSEQAIINRGANIQLQDEEILRAIEKEFKTNWIER